ncbi:MAG: hypothetical protein JNK89_10550 [Saprospiraceae bacterium]|nr:hypothetical protein [Saprospiraceae bacterium]
MTDSYRNTPEYFDNIIAGAGLAGLTAAAAMAGRPFFQQKRILLIDRDDKQKNDRTWCFWASDAAELPPVIHRSWDHCNFFAPGFEKKMAIAPYRYHLVRGIDFYRWASAQIALSPNIQWKTASIQQMNAASGWVQTDAGDFQAGVILNSAFLAPGLMPAYPSLPFSLGQDIARRKKAGIALLQHFKGWMIETATPAFDPGAMTFMDFRLEQRGETRFVYVLPFSNNQALVEFTVFSPALLPALEYDGELKQYIQTKLQIRDFQIRETEFGVIPMSNFPFPHRQQGKTIHSGPAGGFVKASSGYAFKRTQEKIAAFITDWENRGQPDARVLPSPGLFRAFDHIFLQVLKNNNALGGRIFTRLFQRLPPDLVLRFLDEGSTFVENLRLVSAPPTGPFLRAFFQQLPRLLRF